MRGCQLFRGMLAAVLGMTIGCSDNAKSIPPKVVNTELPSAASSDGGKPAAGPKPTHNVPKSGSSKVD